MFLRVPFFLRVVCCLFVYHYNFRLTFLFYWRCLILLHQWNNKLYYRVFDSSASKTIPVSVSKSTPSKNRSAPLENQATTPFKRSRFFILQSEQQNLIRIMSQELISLVARPSSKNHIFYPITWVFETLENFKPMSCTPTMCIL